MSRMTAATSPQRRLMLATPSFTCHVVTPVVFGGCDRRQFQRLNRQPRPYAYTYASLPSIHLLVLPRLGHLLLLRQRVARLAQRLGGQREEGLVMVIL